jgi:hypothetical protein
MAYLKKGMLNYGIFPIYWIKSIIYFRTNYTLSTHIKYYLAYLVQVGELQTIKKNSTVFRVAESHDSATMPCYSKVYNKMENKARKKHRKTKINNNFSVIGTSIPSLFPTNNSLKYSIPFI